MKDVLIPCAFAVVTALWFALMARRGGRSWVAWAVMGAVPALVISTAIMGLVEGASTPFSDADAKALLLKTVIGCAVVILIYGWLFTIPLHRQDRSFWRALSAGRRKAEPALTGPAQAGKGPGTPTTENQ